MGASFWMSGAGGRPPLFEHLQEKQKYFLKNGFKTKNISKSQQKWIKK